MDLLFRRLCLMMLVLVLLPGTVAQGQTFDWNQVVRATPALVPAQANCDPYSPVDTN